MQELFGERLIELITKESYRPAPVWDPVSVFLFADSSCLLLCESAPRAPINYFQKDTKGEKFTPHKEECKKRQNFPNFFFDFFTFCIVGFIYDG